MEQEYGKLYSNLFNKRHEGDYQDFQVFDEETVKPLIEKVEDFILAIEHLVK